MTGSHGVAVLPAIAVAEDAAHAMQAHAALREGLAQLIAVAVTPAGCVRARWVASSAAEARRAGAGASPATRQPAARSSAARARCTAGRRGAARPEGPQPPLTRGTAAGRRSSSAATDAKNAGSRPSADSSATRRSLRRQGSGVSANCPTGTARKRRCRTRRWWGECFKGFRPVVCSTVPGYIMARAAPTPKTISEWRAPINRPTDPTCVQRRERPSQIPRAVKKSPGIRALFLVAISYASRTALLVDPPLVLVPVWRVETPEPRSLSAPGENGTTAPVKSGPSNSPAPALRFADMCAACAMAAAAGATGARTWLQTRHMTWLTPKRIKAATIALFVAAFGFSTIGLSSSSSTHTHPPPAPIAGR